MFTPNEHTAMVKAWMDADLIAGDVVVVVDYDNLELAAKSLTDFINCVSVKLAESGNPSDRSVIWHAIDDKLASAPVTKMTKASAPVTKMTKASAPVETTDLIGHGRDMSRMLDILLVSEGNEKKRDRRLRQNGLYRKYIDARDGNLDISVIWRAIEDKLASAPATKTTEGTDSPSPPVNDGLGKLAKLAGGPPNPDKMKAIVRDLIGHGRDMSRMLDILLVSGGNKKKRDRRLRQDGLYRKYIDAKAKALKDKTL